MHAFEVEGARLSYRRDGAGDPVVLVHSTGCSGSQWGQTTEGLAHAYHVIRPDLYGHGGSAPWPGRRAVTLRDEAAVVGAVMEMAGGPVHLVGHSYGGAVALRAAMDFPGRVRTLTVVEPAAFFLLRGRGQADDRLAAEIEEVALAVVTAVVTGAHDDGMEHFVDYWNGDGAWAALPEERRTALSSRIHAVALNFAAVSAENLRLADFRRLVSPTLVVRGDRSPATTRRIAEMLAATVPGARLETVAGAGHMLPMTHREIFERALLDHIGRWPATGRAIAA